MKSESTSGPGSLTIASLVGDFKDKFKNEDDAAVSPFQGLDKATVLQETKLFSDANTVTRQPRKCCQLITKLLHILTQGEPFTSTETTDVFFGVTKLFQSKDANLRRMMYLFIKEVAEATAADEVIIVTQSLTKDMNSDIDLYRGNAIRVLCRIIDGSMLTAIERYIKQAIVDKNNLVASSALVSGIHLIAQNPQVIQRWVNEVQEAMNSSHDMVQYHAASLLYKIRQHDKLAISKLVSQLQKQTLRSPLAMCLLIRYTAILLREDMTSNNATGFYQFLESMLRHKQDMVVYEAARAICALPIDARDLSPAINVLQVFLSSPSPILRFAAVRTLSQVAMTQPMVVTKCNEDMESLISDPNRSIATLAITTLLKTGAESSVDRLMKQISQFMNEIADEFKIVVVDAIQALCVKYPQKYRILMNFLSNFLREEGGFEFKSQVTNTFIYLIERLPETKETGLLHLCEFIEDCEFTVLSMKILHFLGQHGPHTTAPARYIRFIYNRVILENAAVRAASVSALTQFALQVDSLRASIVILLHHCLDDDDDEVRDRTTLYLQLLQSTPSATSIYTKDLPMHVIALQKSLQQYQLRPAEGPVTFDALPFVEVAIAKPKKSRHRTASQASVESIKSKGDAAASTTQPEEDAKALYEIPQFATLGALFCSSKRIALSEEETEYVVHCVKHVFPQHVVLQFNVLNTVNDQMLSNVTVNLELSDEGYDLESSIPLSTLKYGDTGRCYVCLRRTTEDYPILSVNAELKFQVHEVDPDSGDVVEDGFDEEYPLEDFELSAADFMAKVQVGDFRSAWEQIGDEAEVKESYALQFKSLEEAVVGVVDNLGMQPCDTTDRVNPREKAHVILLSGVFTGGIKTLVKCRVTMEETRAVLQMVVRSEDPLVSQIISDCIH